MRVRVGCFVVLLLVVAGVAHAQTRSRDCGDEAGLVYPEPHTKGARGEGHCTKADLVTPTPPKPPVLQVPGPNDEPIPCHTADYTVYTVQGAPYATCDIRRGIFLWAWRNESGYVSGTIIYRDRCSWLLRGYHDIPPLDCYPKKESDAR